MHAALKLINILFCQYFRAPLSWIDIIKFVISIPCRQVLSFMINKFWHFISSAVLNQLSCWIRFINWAFVATTIYSNKIWFTVIVCNNCFFLVIIWLTVILVLLIMRYANSFFIRQKSTWAWPICICRFISVLKPRLSVTRWWNFIVRSPVYFLWIF